MTAALVARVLEHARRTPHAPAIATADRTLCYRELAARIAAVGAALAARGCGPGGVVGLYLPRSADHVVAMLGAWHAGAAFLPLPSGLPAVRLQQMARDAGVRIILAAGGAVLDAAFDPLPVVATGPATAPAALTGDALAYVIYTSGSTGAPKGVRVAHRGLGPVLAAQVAAFAIEPASRCLWLLSPGFDASISDVGTALWAGAALHIEPVELLRQPRMLARRLAELAITHVDLPPALLPHLDPAAAPELETVVIGGEVAPAAAVRRWASQVRLVNVYGPTEATICASLGRCGPDWERPLIGAPIAGARFRIVDPSGNPAADGSAGELWIGGPILALGYTDPELTRTRFVERDGRWYRTGDRVVRDSDGAIQFLGRLDRQVKVAGQLVAPEEIEARLRSHPAVDRAAVIPRSAAARTVLEAWVAVRSPVTADDLRAHLAAVLPGWMVPSSILVRDTLPQTAAGKLDLSALPSAPRSPGAGPDASAPLGDAATTLLAVCSAALGRGLELDDDLIAAGCDSLGAIEIVAAAEARGLPLTSASLHQHRTVRRLAQAIHGRPDARPVAELSDLARRAARSLGQRSTSGQAPGDRPQVVLVTGATGFLGRHLVRELLRRTDAELRCLVRARDDEAATERLTAAVGGNDPRLRAIRGDLEAERLGLAPAAWERLAAEVDTVHHGGGLVNLAWPYDALEGCNVGGTREVLHLLTRGRPKRLHHASTLSVFVAGDRNAGALREDDALEDAGRIFGGYAQSKWVAEALVRQRADLGPITCYRFGLLTGDLATAAAPAGDWLARCVRALAGLGRAPAAIADLAFDVTPVDYAAAAMVALSLRPPSAPPAIDTYHIANPAPATGAALLDALRRAGTAITAVDDRAWTDLMDRHAAGAGQATAMLGLCRVSDRYERARPFDLFQATGVVFDQRNTEAGLAGTDLRCPPASPALLERYVRAILAERAP